MKIISLLILLTLLVSATAFCTKPTAKLDTLKSASSSLTSPTVVTFFEFTASTTWDTLEFPIPVSRIDISHNGDASGDTLRVSYAQSGFVPKFTDMLWSNTMSVFRDFKLAYITRIIIKANASCQTTVTGY